MKGLKTLFGSLIAMGVLFSSNALAETKATEQATEDQAVEVQVVETNATENQVTEKVTKPVIIGDKLNINNATSSDIQKALIGIGAKKADAIVEYREKHGPFTAVEQLMEVQGIGKATLDRNKDRIIL